MTTRTRRTAVLYMPLLVAALAACGTADAPRAAGSGAPPAAGSGAPSATDPTGPGGPTGSAGGRPPGEPAVWALGGRPLASSTTFVALVSRLDCNSGVTGQVLPPQIRAAGSEVIVTFSVAPKQSDLAQCPANDQVPYTVDLGEPLRGRALVDGHCLPGQPGERTSFCLPDGIRLRP